MRTGAVGASLLLLACGSVPDDAPVSTPSAAPVVQQVNDPRVAELQVVIAELLDRIEVMNARIQKLEAAPAPRTQVVAAARTAPETPADAAAAEEPSRAEPARPARPPRVASAAPPAAEQYRAALELFGKGRVDQARAAFQQVFDLDHDGELADNALYWVGETYYVTGKYAEAMTHYRRVVDEYSDQNKAPDAMLKIGLSYAKIGDLALARRTFQELIAKYPYSTSAAAAKYELKRIQY